MEGCLQHYFHLPMLWAGMAAPDYFALVGGLLHLVINE